MPPEPLFQARHSGLTFHLFADRIEVDNGRDHRTIPLADVASAAVVPQGMLGNLLLVRQDGTRHQYQLGDNLAALRALRAAAPALMPEPGPAPAKRAPAQPEIRVKEYKSAKEFEADAQRMIAAGWRLQDQVAQAGHVNVGRTATGAVLTGGFSLLLGASRTKGKITVTWLRGGEAVTKVCPQCAEEVKAAAKVCRFCQYAFEA
jgi:hypothetical protein